MKKIHNAYIFFTLFFFNTLVLKAQSNHGIQFSFSTSSGTVPAGATSVITAQDDNAALLAPVGFSFKFSGVTYSKVIVSSNGWVALAPASLVTIPAWYVAGANTGSLSTYPGTLPFIAPLWDNLYANSVNYTYNSGTNSLTIRWNTKWTASNPAAQIGMFGLTLDGATGIITFAYNLAAYNAATPPSVPGASIGIAGVCPGDYYFYKPSTSNVDSTNADPHSIVAKPGISLIFTPYQMGDNCSANPYPALDLGTITTTCSPGTYSLGNATSSGAGPGCSSTDVNDMWFKLIKPLGALGITVTTSSASCGSITGTTVELYTACGGTVIPGSCATTGSSAGFGEVTLSRPCAAETLWVRVTGDGNEGGKFQICAKSVAGTATGFTCASAVPICSLPYNQPGLTTAGAGNEYDSINSSCHDPFMNGEDYLFAYTPLVNECIKVSLTSSGINPGVFVFDGCPNLLASTHCIASYVAPTGTLTINSVSLKSGTTYYILVDNDTIGAAPPNIPFNLQVTSVGISSPYDSCGIIVLPAVVNNSPCSWTNYTTECATPSYTSYTTPTCGNFTDNLTGDIWLNFTANFTGNLLIKTRPGSTNPAGDIAMALYTGTSCSSLSTLVACDDNSAGSNMPLLSVAVTSGTTYYIRLWTVAPNNSGSFDLCISSACAPPNDFPCSAVLIPSGSTASGFNTCAGSGSEPANSAQCVAGGTINTVWYKCVVPASGKLKIRTHTHSLTDTQIQAFTFAGGSCSGTATTRGCNDDGPDCDGTSSQSYHDFSELLVTALTPGDTLWVAVDGYNSKTGTFDITIIDGNLTSFPPIQGADCAYAYEACGPGAIIVDDPGILGYGNICDFQNSNQCWANGERNSAWYKVTVNPGTFQFDVKTLSDYDFLLWDITGVSNPCGLISTNSLASARCNWTTTVAGHTGISIADPNSDWEPAITVSGVPHTYMLLLDNWNPAFNTTGYTLDWMSSPIASSTTSVTWSGTVDSSASNISNWGTPPCNAIPTCGIDVTVVSAGSGFNPVVSSNLSVGNIVINSGGTLHIKPGVTLSVCGNFTNNGNFIADAGSTIVFSGSGTQTINGLLNSPNSFSNLNITKTAGTVVCSTNVEVSGNFITSNSTSIFNINGKYMKLQGNFTNASGNTTFTGTAGSTLEFNGTSAQYFTNSITAMSLDKVQMNNTVSNLYLSATGLSTLNIDNELTLTSGKINTRALAGLEVNLKNPLPASLIAFGATSYIDGKFRRKISNGVSSPATPAVYNFPVGDSLISGIGGYENAAITFTTPTLIPNLLAYFSPFPSTPPNGPTTSECPNLNYALGPLLNNGYWTIERNDPTFYGGTYKVTLNNTGYTNANGSSNSFTVITSPNIANPPSNASSWTAYPNLGVCNAGSTTAANTYRDGFNSPASTAASFNHLYSTGQAIYVLPVKLLSFTAEPTGDNVTCKWTTASETNNNYFEVEKSLDAKEFKSIGRVNGFGAGTSTELRNYSFVDQDRCTELQYYRLKQVDIDGQFSYSDPVAVNCKNTSELEVYPNPATSTLIYKFLSDADAPVTTSVIDISGRVLLSEKLDAVKVYNVFSISIEDLAAGSYYIRVNNSNTQQILQAQFSKSEF